MRKMMNLPLLLNEILFFLRLLQKTLHILMHGLRHHFAVGNGFHDGSGTVDHIAGGENTRAGGVSSLIGHQKSPVVGSQSLGSVDDPVLRSLADGDNHAVCRIEMMGIRNIGECSIFIFNTYIIK